MGRSGSASAQHRPHRARAPGKFPSGKRLGAVHRCGHSGSKCPGSSDCVPPLGQTGAVQNTDAYESEASDLNGTASEPSLGIPGIFRVPAFQQGKWVFTGEWCGTDWLADWEYIKKQMVFCHLKKTLKWGVPRYQRHLGYYEKIYQVLKTYFRFIYEFIVTVICE